MSEDITKHYLLNLKKNSYRHDAAACAFHFAIENE